jgi:hypothetical protein
MNGGQVNPYSENALLPNKLNLWVRDRANSIALPISPEVP